MRSERSPKRPLVKRRLHPWYRLWCLVDQNALALYLANDCHAELVALLARLFEFWRGLVFKGLQLLHPCLRFRSELGDSRVVRIDTGLSAARYLTKHLRHGREVLELVGLLSKQWSRSASSV